MGILDKVLPLTKDDGKNLHDKLNRILERLEKPMAESPEVTAFRARVEAALANVSADIQRLLDRNPGLSDEDKAALETIATNLENLAAVVPEE